MLFMEYDPSLRTLRRAAVGTLTAVTVMLAPAAIVGCGDGPSQNGSGNVEQFDNPTQDTACPQVEAEISENGC